MDAQARGRQESQIELDIEFLRPKFTLVFALAAIFILIVLNVVFWQVYLKVIIWAVAASQLIRPLSDDFVRSAKRLYAERKETRQNILVLFHKVIIFRRRSSKDEPTDKDKRFSIVTALSDMMSFMFTNPTVFLAIFLCFHLMPLHVFALFFVAVLTTVLLLSVFFDITGITDVVLRSMTQPHLVSTLIIVTLVGALFLVDATIFVATTLEIADFVTKLSKLLSELLLTLSKENRQTAVTTFSAESVNWIQENMIKVYNYGDVQFGERKWWAVVEAMKTSIENGEPTDRMARSGIEQMRLIYNDTEWLDLVEMAVMAAIPDHRVAFSRQSNWTSMVHEISFKSMYVVMGETIWRFSRLFYDIMKFMSEFAGQVLVFIFIVQTLCKSSRDVITCVCIFTVPASSKDRQKLNDNLRIALRSALTDPLSQAHKNSLVVLIVYGLLGIPGAFISCTFVYATSVFRVFPEGPSLLVSSLPWLCFQGFRLYLQQNWTSPWMWFDIARAALLPIMLTRLNNFANLRRQNSSHDVVSPWLSDFSLAVGVSRFGLDGIILGPFLAAVSYVVLNFVLKIAEQDLDWDDAHIASIKRSSELGIRRNLTFEDFGHSTEDSARPTRSNYAHNEHVPEEEDYRGRNGGNGKLTGNTRPDIRTHKPEVDAQARDGNTDSTKNTPGYRRAGTVRRHSKGDSLGSDGNNVFSPGEAVSTPSPSN